MPVATSPELFFSKQTCLLTWTNVPWMGWGGPNPALMRIKNYWFQFMAIIKIIKTLTLKQIYCIIGILSIWAEFFYRSSIFITNSFDAKRSRHFGLYNGDNHHSDNTNKSVHWAHLCQLLYEGIYLFYLILKVSLQGRPTVTYYFSYRV